MPYPRRRVSPHTGLTLAEGFICGLAAGVVAGRLAPPLFAMAWGTGRVAAGGDPLAVLIADHRHFLSLLTDMEESRDNQRLRRIQLLLRLKRRLAAHALAEEDVVYPLLQAETEAQQDATQLYAEHAAMKVLLFRLEQKVAHGIDWADEVSKLRMLIATHARHEEEVDFPRLRDTLENGARVTLARKISREKALIL